MKQLEPFTECHESAELVLECVCDRHDTFSEWFRDGEALGATSGKMDILNLDGRKHRLHIKSLTPADSGVYVCRINSQIQTSTVLAVKADVLLKIMQGLQDMHVAEAERNVKLSVEVNKSIQRLNDRSRSSIKWLLNKTEIKPSSSDLQAYSVDNKLILQFLRPISYALDNNAHVECRMQEFKAGLHCAELSTKCRLIVGQLQQQTGLSSNRYFTKKLDDSVQADSGLNLDMEARVNFEANLVRWLKNNAQLSTTDTAYTFLNDPLNRSYVLRIKTCRPRDSGIYTIDVDGLQCSGEVRVLDTPIQFIQPLQDQFYDLEVDSSLTLDCQLNKPPQMVNLKPRWFKNDLEISANRHKYDMVEEHNICALIIYDLDERDEGRYRCQVGMERTECLLRPEYTLSRYLPNHVELREGEMCTLSFALNRTPNSLFSTPPVTKWFKDGVELNLEQNPNKFWLIEHANERSLSIQNSTQADSGLYKAYLVDEDDDGSGKVKSQVPLVTTNSSQVSVKKLKVCVKILKCLF